jgi:hypothetical protein
MTKISLLLSILLIFSSCAVASLATATVKTTAAIIALPIKLLVLLSKPSRLILKMKKMMRWKTKNKVF